MKQFLIIFTCFICFLLLSAEKAPTGKIAYSSGKLQGRKLSDLYAVYLGFDSHKTVKVGSKIKVNFAKAYTEMWQCKQDQCPSKVAAQAGETLVAEYTKKHTSITFTAYTDHISVVVKGLKKSINWAKVADLTNIKPGDTTLVKNIVNSFSGKDMSAYILTELMPSADGSLNVTMLDFLLRNAGREYIEGIPALHDGKTSFGPYQFTEYAIFGKEDAERGASVINQAVSGKQKIPGSVIYLRGDDHHRAAFLFAVYNVCAMVRNLNATEKKTLKLVWAKNKDDLFYYCATAHHNPAQARKAAKLWLDHKAVYSFEKSCGTRIGYYAKKTRNNLNAI